MNTLLLAAIVFVLLGCAFAGYKVGRRSSALVPNPPVAALAVENTHQDFVAADSAYWAYAGVVGYEQTITRSTAEEALAKYIADRRPNRAQMRERWQVLVWAIGKTRRQIGDQVDEINASRRSEHRAEVHAFTQQMDRELTR